jgi:hypothetical protein
VKSVQAFRFFEKILNDIETPATGVFGILDFIDSYDKPNALNRNQIASIIESVAVSRIYLYPRPLAGEGYEGLARRSRT